MVVPKPSDQELKAKVRELVLTVDLETMGLKAFVKKLSDHFDVDLKPRKAYIKEVLTEALNEGQDEAEESSSEEEDVSPKKKSKGGGGGLKATKELSDKLAQFLGKGKEMARTEVVSALWDYIKEHNLQNPENKREIILDAAMRDVFECETFTMFTINKYISAHIHPFKPVDLTTNNTTPSKRKKSSLPDTPKSSKRKKKQGNQPPYRLSEELTAVVGTDILPRPQVVKQMWVYIKANNLQDEKDKRKIVCDDLLLKVFKKPKISMFQMNAELSRHIIERVDRSEYQHEESGSDNDEEEEES